MVDKLLSVGLLLGERGRYSCVGFSCACSVAAYTPPKACAIWRSTISDSAWLPSSRMPLMTSSANAGSLRYGPAIASSCGLLLIVHPPLPVLPIARGMGNVGSLRALVAAA